jgi:hypothetical protein
MKKLLLTIATATILVSCNQNTKTGIVDETDVLMKNGSTYTMKITKKRNDGVRDTVTFRIDNVLVDSLKIKESDIKQMCMDAVWFADFNVKFKPTYTLPKEAMLFYHKDVSAHIRGTAENAYGVKDEMSTMMSFDNKHQIIVESIVSL